MMKFCNDLKICGTKIYRTDEMGEVSIEIDSEDKIKLLYKFNKNCK